MSEIKAKFDAVSEKYDSQRRKFIPCFDDFYGVTVSLAPMEIENPKILDIGAGTGLLTAFFLEKYPNASITLIDLSDKMLEVAKERFSGKNNIEYITADYLKYQFNDTYDMVVSALSIHHLEEQQKKDLFRKVYAILKHGGIFINADQTYGETPFLEEFNKRVWRDYIESSGLTEEEIKAGYERISLDKESKLSEQVEWLQSAGFCDVGCVYKFYHFAVMCGRKV